MNQAIEKFVRDNLALRCYVAVIADAGLNMTCLERRDADPLAFCGANLLHKGAIVSAFEGLEGFIHELEEKCKWQDEAHDTTFNVTVTKIFDGDNHLLVSLFHPPNPVPQD